MVVPYDPLLPIQYQSMYDLLWNKFDSRKLQSSRLFEKDKIEWFRAAELVSKRSVFRTFYRTVVDEIYKQLPQIRQFAIAQSTRLPTIQSLRKGTRKSIQRTAPYVAHKTKNKLTKRARSIKGIAVTAKTPVSSKAPAQIISDDRPT